MRRRRRPRQPRGHAKAGSKHRDRRLNSHWLPHGGRWHHLSDPPPGRRPSAQSVHTSTGTPRNGQVEAGSPRTWEKAPTGPYDQVRALLADEPGRTPGSVADWLVVLQETVIRQDLTLPSTSHGRVRPRSQARVKMTDTSAKTKIRTMCGQIPRTSRPQPSFSLVEAPCKMHHQQTKNLLAHTWPASCGIPWCFISEIAPSRHAALLS